MRFALHHTRRRRGVKGASRDQIAAERPALEAVVGDGKITVRVVKALGQIFNDGSGDVGKFKGADLIERKPAQLPQFVVTFVGCVGDCGSIGQEEACVVASRTRRRGDCAREEREPGKRGQVACCEELLPGLVPEAGYLCLTVSSCKLLVILKVDVDEARFLKRLAYGGQSQGAYAR